MKKPALQVGDCELTKIDGVELDKYLGGVRNLWPNDPPANANPPPPQNNFWMPVILPPPPMLPPGGVAPGVGGAFNFLPLLPANGDPFLM
jgi:hypothetical protein